MWGESAELGLARVAVSEGRYEGNTANLALASDVGSECRFRAGRGVARECRISVAARCGERV